jgi:hypothetical protein
VVSGLVIRPDRHCRPTLSSTPSGTTTGPTATGPTTGPSTRWRGWPRFGRCSSRCPAGRSGGARRHVFNSDNPLGAGSPWLAFYGAGPAVPDLSRITVDGSTGVEDYLRVTVHEHGRQVLTWTRVPFQS